MKRTYRIFFSVFFVMMLIVVLSVAVNAEEYSGQCGDDLIWKLDTVSGELLISGTGNMYNYSFKTDGTTAPWGVYASEIKSVIIDDGVTNVGAYAFYECKTITNVLIGEGVTEIGNYAFYDCDGITMLKLPSTLQIISQYAFYDCDGFTSLTFPDNLKTIGSYAFHGCGKVTSLVMDDSLETIGSYAFGSCIEIRTIVMSQSLKTIGSYAFNSCISLIFLDLPASLKTIGESAFYRCWSMIDVTFNGNLDRIGLFAFEMCDDLESAYFYGEVNNFNISIFVSCDHVTIYCIEGSEIHSYVKRNKVDYELITCIHDYISEYREPTCTKSAYTEMICKKCGESKIYAENEKATGHSFTVYIDNNNATCFNNSTATAICDNGCGALDTVEIDGTMLGHIFTNYINDNNQTCINNTTATALCDHGCGTRDTVIIEGTALGHNYTNYINDNNADCIHDGTKTAVCDNGCGASDTIIIEGSALGHSFTNYINDNNNDCIHDGTKTAVCDNGCGASDTIIIEGSALGHSFTNYVIIIEQTCTINGEKEAYCDNGCGEKNVIIEKAEGHIPTEWIVIEEPTYYDEGYQIKNCTVCSEVVNTEVIPVLIYNGFPDVWDASWYAEGIEYCFKHGYITGTDEGIFKPNAELTREQFVVILARISGAKLSEYTESPFDDVKADSWYGASVIWANTEGLVNGIGNGKFGVGQPMTREQLAVIFYRYVEKQGTDTSEKAELTYCDDAYDISTWAIDACAWAIKAELLGSTSESANLLSPKMTVTRAQAAKIFMSYDAIK